MKRIRTLFVIGCALFLSNLFTSDIYAQDKTDTTAKEIIITNNPEKPDPNDGLSESTRQDIKRVEDAQVAIKNRSDDRYRIGFQDTLSIQVYRHDGLSQTVSVNPDGTIRLFRIDNPIVAVCKTERELAYTIETLYKNHLRNPQVNVRAIEQRSQPFAVIGAVQKPGSFFLNQKVRLIQLLSLAGGFDVEKAGMIVQVARIGNLSGCADSTEGAGENQEIEFLKYNLADVIKGVQNPWMEPGDIVSVLVAEEAYVIGDVIDPTNVKLTGPTTLTQAIAMAKGLSKNAKTDKVVIERQEPGTPIKTELVFNLKDIRDKKIPDPLLQANDIVLVSTDRGKAATESLLKALTGGIGNLFFRFPL